MTLEIKPPKKRRIKVPECKIEGRHSIDEYVKRNQKYLPIIEKQLKEIGYKKIK